MNEGASTSNSEASSITNVKNIQDVNSDGDSDTEFYFESDHVALKNNKDYRDLLKTVAILEAQRYRALKDIDTIVELKKEVKEDPVKFLEKLKKGSIHIPEPQVIPPIPNIDWSKYNIPIPDINKTISSSSSSLSPIVPSVVNDPTNSKILVRGRVFDESKPETFNQLWTVEEQQRLEELLIKHPPEDVETNRWRKIAAELGNRTAKQVCSRVQKYFLKLQKAGLPVPGRAPKTHAQAEMGRRSSYPYQRKFSRPTTFFPSQDVPISLAEADMEDSQLFTSLPSTSFCEPEMKYQYGNHGSGESAADYKVKNIMSSRKLELLRQVLQVKEEGDFSYIRHVGIKCDWCQDEPIVGVLWTCSTCPAVDFCTDCVVAQLESPNPHPLSHKIEPVKNVEKKKVRRYDKDYLPPSFSEPGCTYNYLDPNFMPGDFS